MFAKPDANFKKFKSKAEVGKSSCSYAGLWGRKSTASILLAMGRAKPTGDTFKLYTY